MDIVVCSTIFERGVDDEQFFIDCLYPFLQTNDFRIAVDGDEKMALSLYAKFASNNSIIREWLRILYMSQHNGQVIEEIRIQKQFNLEDVINDSAIRYDFFRCIALHTEHNVIMCWSKINYSGCDEIKTFDRRNAASLTTKEMTKKVEKMTEEKNRGNPQLIIQTTGGANSPIVTNSDSFRQNVNRDVGTNINELNDLFDRIKFENKDHEKANTLIAELEIEKINKWNNKARIVELLTGLKAVGLATTLIVSLLNKFQ